MKHALHTDIEIDATPEAVWNILTDLDGYADWNPFITSATGTVAVGERLVNRMRPPGGREMPLKPTVTAVEPEATFEWLGHLGVSGVFDGRHRFELEQTPSGGTRLKHSEFFSGALVRPMRNWLDTKTRNGFIAMNEALKARAETVVERQS